MKKLVILLAVLAANCGGNLPPEERVFLESVRDKLDGTLFDYPTARFRDVRIVKSGGIICGEVNTKNRMGAYAGWKRFVAIDATDAGQPYVHVAEQSEETPGGCDWPESEWRPEDLSEQMSHS